MERNSYLKNFLVLFSGNVVAQIIPFLFAPLLSRIFSSEEFAIQANFMAIVGIIAIVAGGRYELAVVLPKTKNKAVNLIGLALFLTTLISILTLGLVLIKDQIANFYEDEAISDYVIYIGIAVFVSSGISILTNWLIREKKYNFISGIKVLQSLAINLITIFMGYLNFGVDGLIYGWIIGLILSFLMAFYSFNRSFSFKGISKQGMQEVGKEYKDFPLINSAHAFSDLFFSQFVLFAIITREYGLVYLGLFFMMNKYLKAPIRVIGSAVGQIFYKEANDQKNEDEDVMTIFLKSVKLVSYFAVPICIVIFLFGPSLFAWYLGDDWRMSGEYARIMAIPILFNFLVSPVSSITLIYRQQKKAFVISVVGYLLSALAFELGVYLGYSFQSSLMLFAAVMSIYYLYLLFWYISLIKKK
ncbi:oligosaccharide flippase family protein [Crocinitomix catalasitica]|uniref:oligosaccharide flippase family protein n=1 Tax=Crocinitomix catalasitica TaxID=184607 RepID=UPI00047F1A95|nr:oligosaccharide flippase family protein [Crocinitomix catalasitica]